MVVLPHDQGWCVLPGVNCQAWFANQYGNVPLVKVQVGYVWWLGVPFMCLEVMLMWMFVMWLGCRGTVSGDN